MLSQSVRQGQVQKQSQQQKLSPQQIQYIKMLQMSSQHIEQRIKEELESNPALEDTETTEDDYDSDFDQSADATSSEMPGSDADTEPWDEGEGPDVDWDAYHTDDMEGYSPQTTYNPDAVNWQDIPTPYRETQLEKLEQQVILLDLTEKQQLIADQIIGSIDDDGYFRRDLASVADGIAFQNGIPVSKDEVLEVLYMIQRLDPPGIAARDLRECLSIQLDVIHQGTEGLETAQKIVTDTWEEFEKKHFEKIIRKLGITDDEFRSAYECLRMLDPRPGSFETAASDAGNYITPDFEVKYEPEEDNDEQGDFIITMNRRNMPDLVVSKSYEQMLRDMEARQKKSRDQKETHVFIKSKIESARWFMEMLRQRQQTLMGVMQTIVMLQDSFFKTGKSIKPMILKDIAERVKLDVSTISRVVNGKYVQTDFGVYELRYFFNEGITTETGEEVSNLEVKNILSEIIENEPGDKPYSDQKLMELLRKKGFKVARRTVTKYREQLKLPPARLRKKII